MPGKKIRLDQTLVDKGMAQSRQRARAMIMAGNVLVDGNPVDKPGTFISINDRIELKGADLPYVSRGGLKLEAALQALQLDIRRLTCLDVGASTGGFSDCLLQHGAQRVYAVDVGYGQFAWKLRQDPRIVLIERTNIRNLTTDVVEPAVDLATIDVSFISLKIVVPAVLKFMKKDSRILALIKPQFEVGKGRVGKGGVVRNGALHQEVIDSLSIFFSDNGLLCESVFASPLRGPKGNREFFISLKN
jgi:23S rRNA (cytidine1920-2'-O)/16S rRNA (cytidine1409-2'-O)-methyltransferase